MSERAQDVMKEIARWQEETGYSAEVVYRMLPGTPLSGLSDEQREEGVALWKRYEEAWNDEQSARRERGPGTAADKMTCPSCRGTGQALGSGPPGPCRVCKGFGEIVNRAES
jgi:hypothetical protein